MVNIWDYAWELGRMRITTNSGASYTGDVVCVLDAEETEDDEDSIAIELKSGEIKTFYPSEIKSIKTL